MQRHDTCPEANPPDDHHGAGYLDRAEGASTAITKAHPVRSDPDACTCQDTGFWTTLCAAHPGSHKGRKHPLGCGKFSCPRPVCAHKWSARRERLVWDARFKHLPGALLHFTLTVPAALRALVTNVKTFRGAARAVVEAWFRRVYRVAPSEKVFLLDVFHPAGDRDPEAWAPHANIFLLATVLRADGSIRRLRTFAPKAALVELSALWAVALGKPLGVEVGAAHAHLSPHVQTGARRAALKRELRSFPGWDRKGLSRIVWAGAFGPRVWHAIRKGLGIDLMVRGARCAAPSDVLPGTDCGAPMAPFVALDADVRGAVLGAEERTGEGIVEEWEREFHDHSGCHSSGDLPCDCDACTRAARLIAPTATAWRKTWAAAEFSRELVTALLDRALVAPGGPLHALGLAVRDAYDKLQGVDRRSLAIDDVYALREPFLAFITEADRLGLAGDREVSWRKRYEAMLAERTNHDLSADRWQVTINFAWVKPYDPVSRLYPSLRSGQDSEEG